MTKQIKPASNLKPSPPPQCPLHELHHLVQSCAPDGLPYIGRFARHANLTAATGHAMMGLSLAPITGQLIAQLLSGEKSSIDLSALSPDRFN